MTNVVELKSRPTEVVESVVARLEEVLAEARDGKITAVGVATVDADGSIGCTWSKSDDIGKLLGSVARLQYRINANQESA